MSTYKQGYALVNGLNIYYEIHGSERSGENEVPLVVLPGGFMTVEAMGELVPRLAETRQVIGVELQGHGHTGDIERPLHFELMADDIAALVGHLGLRQVDILGYSLGADVGLQTAIRHPELVRKLVVASTVCKRNGWHPESLAGMEAMTPEGFVGTPIHETYMRVSPKPEAWPSFVVKMRNLLSEDYDWSADVAALKLPILLIAGDADGVRTAHLVEFFELLGGGKRDGDSRGIPSAQLAILPSTTHVGWAPPFHGILGRPYVVPMVQEFLDAPVVGA